MTTMRKFAAALVLGLVMCLALFTTGAFAQSVHRGHIGVSVQTSAVAVADRGFNHFGFPFFGGFGGFGFPFFGGFGGGAFAAAHSNVHIFGGDWDN